MNLGGSCNLNKIRSFTQRPNRGILMALMWRSEACWQARPVGEFVMRIFAMAFALLCGLFSLNQTAQAVTISIDLSSQTMNVQSQKTGESINWAISSGRSGYVTPRGSFKPYSLQRMHYSRKYNNSPMPYSIFFRGGYAIHGTGAVSQLGRPASHGCIRLAPQNAAKLFAMVQQEGANIYISGTPPLGKTMIAKAKSKKQFAKASKKKNKSLYAKAGGKKKMQHFAGKKQQANPMAYAPYGSNPKPLKTWMSNPALR